MIFKRLSLTAFMGWAKLDLQLDQYTGVNAILGMIDGDSSHSNGTGKSSLMTALIFALYGKQIAKNMDELIMQGKEDVGFKVALEFEHDGVCYEILRKKKGGAQQKVQFKDLTHDQVLPSEPEAILKMPLSVWENTIYSSQGNLAGIVAHSPSMRKDLLTEIFGMGSYLKLEERAREARTLLDNKLIQELGNINLLNTQQSRFRSTVEEEVARAAESIAALDASIADKQEDIAQVRAALVAGETTLGRANELNKQLQELESEYARVSGRELSAISTFVVKQRSLKATCSASAEKIKKLSIPVDVAALTAERALAQAAEDDAVIAQAALDVQLKQLAIFESDLKVAKFKERSASEALLSFNKLGAKCPTCSSELSSDHAVTHKAKLAADQAACALEVAGISEVIKNIGIAEHISRGKLADLNQRASVIKAIDSQLHQAEAAALELKYATDALSDADAQLATLDAQHMADMVEIADNKSSLSSRKAAIEAERSGFAAIESQNRMLTSQVSALTTIIKQMALDRDTHTQIKHQLLADQEERARLVALSAAASDRAASLTAEKEVYGELIKAFGPSGIPTMILETCLADLQGYLDTYMDLMSEGRIKVTFRTTKTSASTSKLSETLAISVSDINGERDISLYSGGERVRICLAIRLALARLVANRSGSKPGLLLIDEVAELDEAGLNSFIQLLQSVDKEFNQIFLVSHLPELKNACSGALILHRDIYGNYVKG